MPTSLIYVCVYLDLFSSYYPRNWFCFIMPLSLFKDCVIVHHLPELRGVHWNKCPDAPFPEDKGICACLWRWGQLVLSIYWLDHGCLCSGEQKRGWCSWGFPWMCPPSFCTWKFYLNVTVWCIWDSGSLTGVSGATEAWGVGLMCLRCVKFIWWL